MREALHLVVPQTRTVDHIRDGFERSSRPSRHQLLRPFLTQPRNVPKPKPETKVVEGSAP